MGHGYAVTALNLLVHSAPKFHKVREVSRYFWSCHDVGGDNICQRKSVHVYYF